MNLGLANRVAIITGGSEGIGKATALRLSKEGAKVVICARRQSLLNKTSKQIRDLYKGEVLAIKADVTKEEDIKNVVTETVNTFGGIHIVINNAGKSAAYDFESVSDEEWQSDLNLKLLAAIRLARASIPYMRKAGWGRIVNVTNLGGKTPGPASVPTSVTRAAGIALTKALSKDLAKDNILVNTVCIGLIKSGQQELRYQNRKTTEYPLTLNQYYHNLANERRVPLGRVGESHEAGDVIAFLVSERSSYLTGTSINIDGGASSVI